MDATEVDATEVGDAEVGDAELPDSAPGPFTLSITLEGDGAGRVVSAALGIDCPGSCEAIVPADTPVKLTALADATGSFEGWLGPCGGAFDCQFVTLSQSTEVRAHFRGQRNRVFVTSAPQIMGALGGLIEADAECESLAEAAGYPGSYRAWLSTSTVDARDRLVGHRGWIRVDGLPFADSLQDIIAKRIWHPVKYDELGGLLISPTSVITGSESDGTRGANTCADYTSIVGSGNTGSSLGTSKSFSRKSTLGRTCGAGGHFYCFGISYDGVVSYPPAQGRAAFLSGSSFVPGSGIESADALCQTEADTAGLSGTFAALLALDDSSAIDRFELNGLPWVRTDGVALGPTASASLRSPVGPLNTDAAGNYLTRIAVTGARTVDEIGTSTSTCTSWTDVNGGGARATEASAAADLFGTGGSGANQTNCNTATAVYCLER